MRNHRDQNQNSLKNVIEKTTSLIPGIIIGVIFGIFLEKKLSNSKKNESKNSSTRSLSLSEKKASLKGKLSKNYSDKNKTDGELNASASIPSEGSELKMVLVVRKDLKMTSGKIAAQCSHAAVGIFTDLLKRNKLLLQRYEDCGQPKIVVTCNSLQEMNDIKGKAQQNGLPYYIVTDAGRTQVASGSKTVIAIGPGLRTSVDNCTRHLKLL